MHSHCNTLSLRSEVLEPRILLDARLVADFDTTPLLIDRFAMVGSALYFSVDDGNATEIWRQSAQGERSLVSREEFVLPAGLTDRRPVIFEGLRRRLIYSHFVHSSESLDFADQVSIRSNNGVADFESRTDATQDAYFQLWTPPFVVDTQEDAAILINSDGGGVTSVPGEGVKGQCTYPHFESFFSDDTGTYFTRNCASSDEFNPGLHHYRISEGQVTRVESNPAPTRRLDDGRTVQLHDGILRIRPESGLENSQETVEIDFASDGELRHVGRVTQELYMLAANDGTHGDEPWITDGTVDGTRLLRDINPNDGSESNFVGFLKDGLLFAADNGSNGKEIWYTDGTPEGTRILADIFEGKGSSTPSALTEGKATFRPQVSQRPDRNFFFANDGKHGQEIWSTDATPEGTWMLADMTLEGDSFLTSIAELSDGRHLLAIENHSRERSIWITDSTSQGTKKIISLWDVAPITQLAVSVAAPDHFAFRTHDTVWVSNGTQEGTQQVEMAVRSMGSNPVAFASSKETIWIATSKSPNAGTIWTIDSSGTKRVSDFNGTHLAATQFGETTIVVGDSLSVSNRDFDIRWIVDGTSVLSLGDVSLTVTYSGQLISSDFASKDNDVVYMLLSDQENSIDSDLWRMSLESGEAERFRSQVRDIARLGDQIYAVVRAPGGRTFLATIDDGELKPVDVDFDSELFGVEADNGKLFVMDDRGLHTFDPVGLQIERSAILTGTKAKLMKLNGLFYWTSVLRDGRFGLYASDGNQAWEVVPPQPNANRDFTLVGDQVFFRRTDESKTNLYRTDGSAERTLLMTSASELNNLVAFQGELFFTVDGRELWSSDGTTEGTAKAGSFDSQKFQSIDNLFATDETLYFAADDRLSGLELWAIDAGQPEDEGFTFEDFLVLSQNFGQETDMGTAEGDLDENGFVDFSDFLLLSYGYQLSV